MKTKFAFLFCLLCICLNATASNNAEAAKQKLAERVEALRQAMIDANAAKLKELTATDLSYGHSGGHVEGQAEFIEKITSGRSDFVTIELQDQTIQINKDIAIVRHMLKATTQDNGKPGNVNIGVMLVWQKQHGDWKLLARQAFKPY